MKNTGVLAGFLEVRKNCLPVTIPFLAEISRNEFSQNFHVNVVMTRRKDHLVNTLMVWIGKVIPGTSYPYIFFMDYAWSSFLFTVNKNKTGIYGFIGHG